MAGVYSEEEKHGQHKDLRPINIKKSEGQVTAIAAAFNSFIDPFNIDDNRLICLSSGASVGDDISKSLLHAEQLGKEQKEEFIKDRIQSSNKLFFDPIKRNKVKTMVSKAPSKKMNASDSKVIQYKATSSLVFQLFVQSQLLGVHVSTQELMTYPLTVTPYAISTTDGYFAKTNKAQCMNAIIKKEDDAELPELADTVLIVDGNASFYMREVPARMAQIAHKILKSLPKCSEIIFSTDSYLPGSIKAAERERRGCGEKLIIKGGQTKRPVDWTGFLSNEENKQQLIHVIGETWKTDKYAADHHNCPVIYIENGLAQRFFSLDGITTNVERIDDIESSQEETDTRIVLYLKYSEDKGKKYARIKSKDSDVFFILLHYAKQFTIRILLDTGNRMIDISEIADDNTQEWCTALLALHSFTGCDSTSALKGMGKVKPYQKLQTLSKFVSVLAKLGENWQVQESVMKGLEEFCCVLYGHKKLKQVNEVREVKLKKLCGRSGQLRSTTSVDLGYFPPCKRSLTQHIKRANYQAAE